MWTLTISPDAVHLDAFVTILAVVEITRRAIWNIFRLENEQLNNCGKFRALKGNIHPYMPTSFSTSS